MGLNIPFNIIMAYAIGLIALYLIGWLLLVPLKVILKFIANGLVGGLVLFILNYVGKFIGVTIVINPVTALIVGFLGIPGIILILLLQLIL